MTDQSDHLVAAIADLQRRRNEIDNAIQSLRAVLTTVYNVTTETASTTSATSPGRPSADLGTTPEPRNGAPTHQTRAERVRRVFEENPAAVFNSEAIATSIDEASTESILKAIHAILSRMTRAGEIKRVGRGAYRLADTSAPVAAGAEVGGELSSSSSREEGSTGYVPAAPAGGGVSAMESQGHHSHARTGASIAEA